MMNNQKIACFLQKSLNQLTKARENGRLLYVTDFIEAFFSENSLQTVIQQKWGNISKMYLEKPYLLAYGYTTSKALNLNGDVMSVLPPHYTVDPQHFFDSTEAMSLKTLVYQLNEGATAYDALSDLLNPAASSLMILDCQIAIQIAQYYTLFKLLEDASDVTLAIDIFNRLFDGKQHGIQFSKFYETFGTPEYCIKSPNSSIAPLNPLSYFLTTQIIDKDQIVLGDHVYIENYEKHHCKHFLFSVDEGHNAVCTTDNMNNVQGFTVFSLQGTFTEEQIKIICKDAHNKDTPDWYKKLGFNPSLYSGDYKDKIREGDIPGIRKRLLVTRFNLEKINNLINCIRNKKLLAKFIKEFHQELARQIQEVGLKRYGHFLSRSESPKLLTNNLIKFGCIYKDLDSIKIVKEDWENIKEIWKSLSA